MRSYPAFILVCAFMLLWSACKSERELPVPELGLVAYFPFNGDVRDASGQISPGTADGATLQADRFGIGRSAYAFDGSDYLDLGDVLDSLDLPFSISAWVETPVSEYESTAYGHILSTDFPPPSEPFTTYNGFWLQVSQGSVWISYGDGGVGFDARRSAYTPLPETTLNSWTHIAAVVGGPDNMRLYLNGVPANVTYDGGGQEMTHGGLSHAIVGRNFRGVIDDIAVYDRELSEAVLIFANKFAALPKRWQIKHPFG